MALTRKTQLRSKTPLSRGTSQLKRSPFSRIGSPFGPTDAKKREWQNGMKRRIKKPAIAEREHMGIVAGLCCIVCRNLGYGESPAEVHHVRYLAGGGQRSSNMDTIPLCPNHHRIGGYGVAYHAGPEEFERRYGTEVELLEQTHREIGIKEAA